MRLLACVVALTALWSKPAIAQGDATSMVAAGMRARIAVRPSAPRQAPEAYVGTVVADSAFGLTLRLDRDSLNVFFPYDAVATIQRSAGIEAPRQVGNRGMVRGIAVGAILLGAIVAGVSYEPSNSSPRPACAGQPFCFEDPDTTGDQGDVVAAGLAGPSSARWLGLHSATPSAKGIPASAG